MTSLLETISSIGAHGPVSEQQVQFFNLNVNTCGASKQVSDTALKTQGELQNKNKI